MSACCGCGRSSSSGIAQVASDAHHRGPEDNCNNAMLQITWWMGNHQRPFGAKLLKLTDTGQCGPFPKAFNLENFPEPFSNTV